MKGDYTRFTFRRADHYSGVRLQQGRVQLDADWNEQVDLQLDRERTGIRDVVGPVGAPWAEPGFGFVPLPIVGGGGQDFALTPGRMYVHGILVEVGGEKAAGSSLAAGTVVVASAYLDERLVAADDWVEIRGGASSVHRARVTGVIDVPQGKRISFSPTLVPANFPNPVVRRLATYLTQPDLASPPAPAAGSTYLAYLDVWERHVTAHENGRLREVALGGPDTATRTQVAWRVRLEALQGAAVCADFGPGWMPGGQSTGRLRARAQPAQDSATPCIVPQGAGYRRLENQLYRVEIHAGGGAGASYKWSRDNGHVVSRVRSVVTATAQVEVEPQGRDDVLDFAPGQVVELTEPGAALRGETGLLAGVTKEADGTLTLAALVGAPALDLSAVAAGWEVRRWEGTAAVLPDQWVDLEEGVQVRFEPGGVHRAGDWWAVPARTATADVEWPREGDDAAAVPPHGVAHAYCPLGILSQGADGAWSATDCRKIFPPLTAMVRMVYLGGDGQEAMPTTPTLRYPLQVGVLNGGLPVDGALVRFSIVEGAGQLNGGSGFGPGPVTVATVAGVASCQWRLGTGVNDHQVRAELLQYGADAEHPDIHFNANLSQASEVHFAAPPGCTGLQGSTTVQDALERLARTANLFYVGGDGQHAVQGEALGSPLVVRLVSDCGPVQGVPVTFAASDGGRLATGLPIGSGQGAATLTVNTDASGTARVHWRLAEGANTPVVQRVTATLPAQLPDPWRRGAAVSVEFSARRLLAADVQYRPASSCAVLQGATDVQQALDTLCANLGGRRPGIPVIGVRLNALTSLAQLNDAQIRRQELEDGIAIDCGEALDPASFNGPNGLKPTCYVTLSVPEHRLLFDETGTQRLVLVGARPVVLESFVRVVGSRITWTPTPDAIRFIQSLQTGEAENLPRMLAQLTLKGRFIWGGEPRRYLGGMEMGVPGPPDTRSRRPTHLELDDGEGGEEGSDFELWFWIGSPNFDNNDEPGTTITAGGFPTLVGGGRTGGTVAPGATGPAGGTTIAAPAAPGGAVKLATLEVPDELPPGKPATGTVGLSGPAPKGGVKVTLTSNDKGGARDEVVIPVGKTEAPFRLDLASARSGTRLTITATSDVGTLQKQVVIKKA